MSDQMNSVDWLSVVLTIIGAINWGLVGLFNYNLIDSIFGTMSVVSRVIYTIVGLAGLYLIATAAKISRQDRVLHGGEPHEMYHPSAV